MVIERSGFLLIAGTLAAGGVGGWLAHDSKAHPERIQEPVVALTASVSPPTPAPILEHVPVLPVCDDSVGTPDDCPAMGPADEGVCSNVAAKRCAEFKLAFKPRVATGAVSCLRHLKPGEVCDPARVNLCGHTALMAACPDASVSSMTTGVDAGSAASSPVALACDTIVKGCGNQALGPTLADCRQTLSGMTDAGRASMIECMATHCGDKGLLGCEGLKKI